MCWLNDRNTHLATAAKKVAKSGWSHDDLPYDGYNFMIVIVRLYYGPKSRTTRRQILYRCYFDIL